MRVLAGAAVLLNGPWPLVTTSIRRLQPLSMSEPKLDVKAFAVDVEALAGCIRLEKAELPDCIDSETPGSWYACDDPPRDEATLQCFAPEGLAVQGKQWICVETTSWSTDSDGEDSF